MPNTPIVPIDNDRQLISEVALDIGKEVVAHIEIMYPEALEAVPKNARLSIRNCVHNEIMAALDTIDVNEIRARLERRRAFRRQQLKAYRGLRSDDANSPSRP